MWRDEAHLRLLYAQHVEELQRGEWVLDRVPALRLAALILRVAHGRHAHAQPLAQWKAALTPALRYDATATDELAREYAALETEGVRTRQEGRSRFLALLSQQRLWGLTPLPLRNSAMRVAVGARQCVVYSHATGHVVDQWRLAEVQHFELRPPDVVAFHVPARPLRELQFGCAADREEFEQVQARYLRWMAEAEAGRLPGVSLDFPVALVDLDPPRTATLLLPAGTRFPALLRAAEEALGLRLPASAAQTWGGRTSSGAWVSGEAPLSALDMPALELHGLELRPRVRPLPLRLPDRTVLLLTVDVAAPLGQWLHQAGEVLGVPPCALGLREYLGEEQGEAPLLMRELSLHEQHPPVREEAPLALVFVHLSKHTVGWTETALHYAYAQAQAQLEGGKAGHLTRPEVQELRQVSQRLLLRVPGPVPISTMLLRYCALVGREVPLSLPPG